MKIIGILFLLIVGVTDTYAATYTYDELNRLTAVTYATGQTVSYSYDAGGNILNVTASQADTTPPAATTLLPAANATRVPLGQAIGATFDKALLAATVNGTSFTLNSASDAVAGTASYSGDTRTAWFIPSAPLSYDTLYTASISTAVTDLYGNSLAAPLTWSFTTAPPPDLTPPAVTAQTPAAAAQDVPRSVAVTVTFSEPVQAATVIGGTFTVTGPSGAVAGSVTLSGQTASFIPAAALAGATVFTARVTTALLDLAGNPLESGYVWAFTTEPAVRTLSVAVLGTGKGSINSSPAGIACASGSGSGCAAVFPTGSAVTLFATSSWESPFAGWSGNCSGTGSCVLTMNGDKNVSATFDGVPVVKILGKLFFTSLQNAYEASGMNDYLFVRGVEVFENVLLAKPIAITIVGGLDNTYFIKGESPFTVINGSLTVQDGSVTIDSLIIR